MKTIYDWWIHAGYMVMYWIINSMNSDIAESFMYVTSSKKLWDEITERFSESNAPLIYQLHMELSNMRQENICVTTYYGKLRRIWGELARLEAPLTCQCGAMSDCECALLKKMLDR